MRKYQQKQILELIKTLYEATSEIKRFLSRKDGNSVMQLLADCQDMAIQIGNYIEQLEGEGTQTVSRLEEYCQLLFQANVEINNIGPDIKIDKPLQKQLIKIENSIKDELRPNKIEVLFISYKASMSDSIESIYLAAKADSYCDAIFVPIPYYDINSDNSLGMMHYEGMDCYGDNIEITDWRKYNIESRHPDVIFTFNPYDEGNYVTRVHPDFFCRRLQEHTDLLVYVPYFVVTDDVPEHFCTTAGCIYAHKVIVQSEKIRDTYIRVFNKTFGDRFGKAKDKFVALGSPKFDKVFNTKREDCVLPDEWSRLINGKKVVLYNTSIGAILQANEQYFKKLRHTLETFRNRDDMVLWWRPHPFSESTYASMRPGLLEEYRAIIADYKIGIGDDTSSKGSIKSSNLIYDNSSDVHRAIAWSDAYYGDTSSVVALYQVTGKPIVMQNVNCNDDEEVCAMVADFALDGDKCWGFDLITDALYQLNVENNSAEFVLCSGQLPTPSGIPELFSHRYITVCTVKDKVVLFPFFTDSVFVYGKKQKTKSIIQLDKKYIKSGTAGGFLIDKAVVFDDCVYAFGSNCLTTIVYGASDDSVSYDCRLLKALSDLWNAKSFFSFPIYLSEADTTGNVQMILIGQRHLIQYNLESGKTKSLVTAPIPLDCHFADFCKGTFWFITTDGRKLISWDVKASEVNTFDIPGDLINTGNPTQRYTCVVVCENSVLIFPGFCTKVLRFDKIEKTFRIFSNLPEVDDEGGSIFKYDGPKHTGEKAFVFCRPLKTMFEIDINTESVISHKFCLGEESTANCCKENVRHYSNSEYYRISGRLVGENQFNAAAFGGNIANYFGMVFETQTGNEHIALSSGSSGTAGKRIYDFVKRAIGVN